MVCCIWKILRWIDKIVEIINIVLLLVFMLIEEIISLV